MPDSVDLYLARGTSAAAHGVPLTVPYRQGDVFKEVDLPGLDSLDGHLVLLFMHPCTMREGPGLRQFVNVLRVRRFGKGSRKDESRWEEGNYSEIPLRGLANDKYIYVADMSAIWTVKRDALPRTTRIASLTDDGMIGLQHRMIFHLTRLSIPYVELHQANRALLAELEMQRGWVEIAVETSRASDLKDIEVAEADFDSFLSANGRRDRLRDTATGEPGVRQEYNEACLTRFGSLPL